MNTDIMQVAETIKSQIHRTVLMCAAARSFTAYENTIGLYGLQFIISNTSKIKFGKVRITLNGADLYNIEILNRNNKRIENIIDIYAEDLSRVLEMLWENKKTLKIWSTKLRNKYSEKEERI